jgi:hypothetical protein
MHDKDWPAAFAANREQQPIVSGSKMNSVFFMRGVLLRFRTMWKLSKIALFC